MALSSPELHQLERALEAAGDLSRRADELTDALIHIAAEVGTLSQREIADLIGVPSASTIGYRLARGRAGRDAHTPAVRPQAPATAAERAEQVRSDLRGLLDAQKLAIATRDDEPLIGAGTPIGWAENGRAWLHPSTTRTQLNQHTGQHWTAQALAKVLADAGIIRTRVSGTGVHRKTIAVRVGRMRHPVDVWECPLEWLATQHDK